MRFTFDTNLLVSAVIKPVSLPGMALEKARNIGELYFSDETCTEINDVLIRDKFDRFMPKHERLTKLDALLKNTTFISDSINPVFACRDSKDDKSLSLATAISATCIVSGDKDLQILHPFRGIPVVTASDFMLMSF